jgi:hypothetical protein
VKTTESVRLSFQVAEPYEDDQEALEVIHATRIFWLDSRLHYSFFFTDFISES